MTLITRTVPAFAGLLMAGMLCAPAHAQERGMLNSLMSIIGLQGDDDGPEIDYRERAPLVVPPQMKLRPPEAPAASRNAAWPNDPDVARRNAAEAARKVPVGERPERKFSEGRLMQPGDFPGSRTQGSRTAAATPEPVYPERSLAASGWISPDKLRTMGGPAKKEEALVAGQEPPRRYLTDPPTGLRTPSEKGPLTVGRSLARPAISEREERDPLNTYRPKPKTDDE